MKIKSQQVLNYIIWGYAYYKILNNTLFTRTKFNIFKKNDEVHDYNEGIQKLNNIYKLF